MHPSRIVVLALTTTLFGVLAACSEGTGPGTEDGTYALMDVNGAVLPVEIAGESWIADTIRIDRGDWARVSVVLQEDETVRRESDGFIRRSGSRLVLDFFCPPNALCLAPDTVYLIAGQLLRTHVRYDGDTSDDPLFRYTEVR